MLENIKDKKVVVKTLVEKGGDLTSLINELNTVEDRSVVVQIAAEEGNLPEVLNSLSQGDRSVLVRYIAETGQVDSWTPEDKQAFANYLLNSGEIDGWTPEDKKAFVDYLLGKKPNYKPKDESAKVNYSTGTKPNYNPKDLFAKVNYVLGSIPDFTPQNKTATLTYYIQTVGSVATSALATAGKLIGNVAHGFNGTAHAQGTAKAKGDWGVKRSGKSLVGELGQELIIRGSKFFTVGDNGAEYADLKSGDIVFNHLQTEELFKNGYVTANGGRGKMVGANANALADGTAHTEGPAFVSGSHSGSGSLTATQHAQTQQPAPAAAAAPAQNYSAPVQQAAKAAQTANKAAEEFKETIDWVEVALDRIQRTVDKLETLSDSIYRLFTDRNKSMTESFAQVTEQIKYQESAYAAYMNKVNSYGLSQDYINKINAGHWSIEDITDKDLHEKIKNVMDYTEKALDARDAIEELRVKLGDIAKARFDLAVTKYDAAVEQLTHDVDMLNNQLDIVKNRGNFAGKSYYETLVERETKVINKLQEEYDNLVDKREEALNTGAIQSGSEADNEMISRINEIEEAWQEATNSVLEYKNAFLEMDTEAFTWAQGLIDDLRSESDFVQELLSIVENKMFNKDTGRLNGKGMAVGSLHAMNYDIAMAQADEYRKKVDELNKAIAKESTNTILINQRDEYLKLQRESIEAANSEKKAVQDLVSNSYNRMLEILQKLINKRKEMLEQEKSLYDYERSIKDQTKTINDYRKQLLSLQGDDSEESRAKRQEISENLKTAEKDLEASEYDRYIQDQERLLDTMYDEFSRVLNERLDNIDGLLTDMIDYGNAHANDIGALITSETSKVGYTVTDGLNSIWNSTESGIGKVLSEYTKNFAGNFTTVNKYIKGIFDILKETTKSKVTVDTPKNNTPAKPATTTPKPATPTPAPAPAKKAITVGGMINAGSAPIYNDSYGSVGPYGTHQYYASDPIYVVMRDYGDYVLARHHTQTAGAGFFKKTDVTALDTGGYTGDYEGMALLHKKERVLNPVQTKAFEQLVYDYLPMMKDQFLNNSGIGLLSKQLSPNPTEINGNLEMNFNLPNVTDADGFIRQLQSDERFERIVQHMVFDGLSGKGNLRKNLVRVGKR